MANSIDEQISALMDGELSDRELSLVLKRMGQDPGVARRWQRYHMIRDALHDTLPANLKFDLSDRVHEALRDEPVVLAPRRRKRDFRPWLRQAAGMAIAASVAAVAILTFQAVYDESPTTMAGRDEPTVERLAQQAPMRTDPRLDAYLLNHNEHSVSTGMHGMLPYVRIVSQDTEGESAR